MSSFPFWKQLRPPRERALLTKMRDLSGGHRPPDGSCPSYRSLYQALQEFERDLYSHIHLEDNVLFPRAVAMQRALQETADVPINIPVALRNSGTTFMQREKEWRRLVTSCVAIPVKQI